MPSAPPFLARGRIQRAAHGHAVVPARDTDVAADALADVLLAAALDLHRQKRVGDRRARRTDEVEYAAPDLPDHCIGGGESPNAYHGLAGDFLHEVDNRI